MATGKEKLILEEVDWPHVAPWLRLFQSFRMAMHPGKMLTALLLVTLLYLGGRVLDAIWGPRAYAGETQQFYNLNATEFARWQESQEARINRELPRLIEGLTEAGTTSAAVQASSRPFYRARQAVNQHYSKLEEKIDEDIDKAVADGRDAEIKRLQNQLEFNRRERRQRLATIGALQPQGIFEAAKRSELEAFERLVNAALSLRLGVTDLLNGARQREDSVAGALRDMVITVPLWMWKSHPVFLIIYSLWALVVWSVLGGMIARMAATQATRGQSPAGPDVFRFVGSRWAWFLITPLLPLVLALGTGLVLLVGGFLLLNLPVLDVAGALLFPLALAGGLFIAVSLVLWAAGVHLFYPALAVESADAFDAISRSFGYVISRPWRWLFYTITALVYGAITYVFVGSLIFLTLVTTRYFVSIGVVREAEHGVNRFDAMLPPPIFGQLIYDIDWALLSAPGKLTAALLWVWVFLLVALLGAYAISYYFCSHTWIYLLLRRSCDGTEFDDLLEEKAAAEPITPAAAAPATPAPAPAAADPAAQAAPDEIEPPQS